MTKSSLDGEILDWAELTFVVEKTHLAKPRSRFRKCLGGEQVVCLDMPDDYRLMEPALVRLLQARMPWYR